MRPRRGRVAAIVAVAVAALALSACSIPTQGADHAVGVQNPLTVLNSTPPGTVAPGRSPTTAYLIYFVFDGALFAVPRVAARSTEPGFGPLDEALELLFNGPNSDERREGVATYFHPLVQVAPVVTSLTDGIATIQLDESFTLLTGTALADAMGQIVYTVTGVTGTPVTGVEFTLAGSPFAGYSPSGAILEGPISRVDYESIAPRS
jgi:spore germination protein GerM